mmetsp:Transcript_28619/g.93499  ORF Transcript_28619/g.93499 Transcript_28619/m.93499 type:complete len:97 (+) Transcript_28619:321-611(+)
MHARAGLKAVAALGLGIAAAKLARCAWIASLLGLRTRRAEDDDVGFDDAGKCASRGEAANGETAAAEGHTASYRTQLRFEQARLSVHACLCMSQFF